MTRRRKVDRFLSKVMVEGLEGTASFLDSFKLPTSKLDRPRKQMFRLTKNVANEYRKLAGAKNHPIFRLKKVKRDIIHIEQLQPINIHKKMDVIATKIRRVMRRKG